MRGNRLKTASVVFAMAALSMLGGCASYGAVPQLSHPLAQTPDISYTMTVAKVTGEQPGEVIHEAFKAVKGLDGDSIAMILDAAEVEYPFSGSEELIVSLVKTLLGRLDYEIVSVDETGDTAAVTLSVTTVNMGAFVATVMERSISLVLSPVYIAKSTQMSIDDKSAMLLEMMIEVMNEDEIPLSVTEIVVRPRKSGGKWALELDGEFLIPVVSGVADLINMVK